MENSKRFRVGLSGCGGGLEAVSSSELLEQAEVVDELGFDALWLNEEHFEGMSDLGGRRCLSPIVLAAAIAARTRKLRIGFSVLLLPLHHPIRLAEEIATLDVLSGGRVDFGISRGGNSRAFAAYGVPNEGLEQRFQENLSFLLRAWQGGTVEVGGACLSVEPKPVQRPHPPVYVGTYTEATAAWIAQSGYSLICHGICNIRNIRRLIHTFADAGGKVRDVPLGRFVYVSETDESARRELWPTILKLTSRLKSIGLSKRPGVLDSEDLEPDAFYREMVIAGSPETCFEKIEALRHELGVEYLNVLSAFFGFLPPERLMRSLQLLASEVRPKLNRDCTKLKGAS